MLENHNIWQSWSRQLHQWGMANVVENLLELMDSFDDIFLHIIYLLQPLVFGARSSNAIQALLALFEDKNARSSFLEILKKADS